MKYRSQRHRDVIAALTERDEETALSQWRARGFAASQVAPLLKLVADRMDYPNWYLFPDDRLHDLINDDTYDFSTFEVIENIERLFPTVNPEELTAFPADATLSDLAEKLFHRKDVIK